MLGKTLLTTLMCSMASLLWGQSILGEWITYDDSSGEAKSVVEIYQNQGKYFGRILKLMNRRADAGPPICTQCRGAKRGRPLVGLDIIEEMTKVGDIFQGGTITNPDSGKDYSCKMWLQKGESNTLVVRGYFGPIYHSQYWKRQQ